MWRLRGRAFVVRAVRTAALRHMSGEGRHPTAPLVPKLDDPARTSGPLLHIIDTPRPPRPAFYVPPEERDPSDESLAFLKPGSPLSHLPQHAVSAKGLPEGIDEAPALAEHPRVSRAYMDADAARVESTSVHAGQSLLHRRAVVDTSAYYFSPAAAPLSSTADEATSLDVSHRTRLHTLRGGEAPSPAAALEPHGANAGAGGMGSSSTAKERSVFAASHEFAAADKTPEQADDERARAAPKSATRQLEADIKKLEYYQGTPQHAKLLAEFRAKYGADETTSATTQDAVYTAQDVERGLAGQPIDYQHGSGRLKTQLAAGPHAYDPITIMQQQGLKRFQGYAFPPTVQLGKLKGDGNDLQALHAAHKSHPLVAQVRQGVNALMGRRDARDDYVAREDRPREDTHLLYRTLGLDAVQRRQMRYMLTDFDHADRNTTFHVMMSYPYTDWLHVFYMVLVGWCLYQLQVRYGAYEFYDEYLGLDLRQVPRLQRPLLAAITVVVMTFALFQPLLVASIATTRAYRIIMKRPVGPP